MIDFVYADVAEAYVAAAGAPEVEGMTSTSASGGSLPCETSSRRSSGCIGGAGAPASGSAPVRPLEQQIEVDPEVAAEPRLARRHPSKRGYGAQSRGTAMRRVGHGAPDATTR